MAKRRFKPERPTDSNVYYIYRVSEREREKSPDGDESHSGAETRENRLVRACALRFRGSGFYSGIVSSEAIIKRRRAILPEFLITRIAATPAGGNDRLTVFAKAVPPDLFSGGARRDEKNRDQ